MVFIPYSRKFLNLSLHFTRCWTTLLLVSYLSCFRPFGIAVPNLLPPYWKRLPVKFTFHSCNNLIKYCNLTRKDGCNLRCYFVNLRTIGNSNL